MTTKNLLTVMLLCITLFAKTQSQLPVIQANNVSVDIVQNGNKIVNAWTIMPEITPDVYETSAEKVTFITDIDSITLYKTKEYDTVDFFILLKSKEKAHTRIHFLPSRLKILQEAAEYNENDNRPFPAFTYQSADDSNLVQLRRTLQLDSIAGNGSELSKIFNLLHWVHRVIRHDGSSDSPSTRNALNILNVCKNENRGVNCRMMAIVLNECYLAVGIKSRYITCMPKETEFNDCHVINAVFSKELNKWIWIDPTFDAYVMDEKGNLLGIEEVRTRLIHHQPLVLNADANWNRENLQSKEYYLEEYMAKNLYRLECPLHSEYNGETRNKGKEITYIELLPLDGILQNPQYESVVNKETRTTYHMYKTNNPKLFWTIN